MKIIIALVTLSLLAAGPAHAQFGKLKNKIKEATRDSRETPQPTPEATDTSAASPSPRPAAAETNTSTPDASGAPKTVSVAFEKVGGPRQGRIEQLAAAPDGTLYARTRGNLWASADGGRSWTDFEQLPQNNLRHFALDAKGGVYAVFGGEGVYRSNDKGKTWANITTGLPEHETMSLIAVGPKGQLAVNSYKAGLYVSSDGGKTWKKGGAGLPTLSRKPLNLESLAFTPSGTLVAGLEHFGTREDVALSRSDDGGMTFTQVGQEVTRVAKSKSANAQMLSVEIPSLASNAQGHLFAGAEGFYGLFRSTDGGQTWKHVGPVPTHHYTGTNPVVKAIAFTPGGHVLIATKTDGIWRSTDNGETWHKLAYVEDDVGALAAAPDGSVYAEGPDGNVFRFGK
ncbi:MAG TPA: hypothetical protein VN282_05985 [Pyrinomonadaceae bacterium]|nr:hypothetical protein [Pyrinomonadaceae bacterium]